MSQMSVIENDLIQLVCKWQDVGILKDIENKRTQYIVAIMLEKQVCLTRNAQLEQYATIISEDKSLWSE